MYYKLVVFGVKDMTKTVISYICESICPIDLIFTISSNVSKKNDISGYSDLRLIAEKYDCEIFEAGSYSLKDERTREFIRKNRFGLGISMGWQRLVPKFVLDQFEYGLFGFHGNCGYLPYGRGRSPLNWSIINGDTRFNLNLFKYDENADSPNVFATEMFSLTGYDTIRTAQYKNMFCSKRLIKKLLDAYKGGNIEIKSFSKDFDSWFNKRTAEDGIIDFCDKTRNIYNLIRGVTYPFPGAYSYVRKHKILIWEAHPFDEMIDFSMYSPGEIIDIYDGKLIVRTVDGSLIVDKYESDLTPQVGDIFEKDSVKQGEEA